MRPVQVGTDDLTGNLSVPVSLNGPSVLMLAPPLIDVCCSCNRVSEAKSLFGGSSVLQEVNPRSAACADIVGALMGMCPLARTAGAVLQPLNKL